MHVVAKAIRTLHTRFRSNRLTKLFVSCTIMMQPTALAICIFPL